MPVTGSPVPCPAGAVLRGLAGGSWRGTNSALQALGLGAGAQEVREVGHHLGGHPAPGLLAVAAQLGIPVGDRLVALLLSSVDQGADVGVRGGPLEGIGDRPGERPLTDLPVGGGLADAVPLGIEVLLAGALPVLAPVQAPAERGIEGLAPHPFRGLVVVAGGMDALQLLLLLGVQRPGAVEVLRFGDQFGDEGARPVPAAECLVVGHAHRLASGRCPRCVSSVTSASYGFLRSGLSQGKPTADAMPSRRGIWVDRTVQRGSVPSTPPPVSRSAYFFGLPPQPGSG